MTATGRYILGIDTSCDDTSMAIIDVPLKKVLSNIVSSQIKIHAEYGGIVPEIASRSHMENLSLVFNETLKKAKIHENEIGAVAVTNYPGLIGCLLVGTSFARGLAYRLGVPLYGINHLEGHLLSPFIGRDSAFPCLGLVVSGGHTAFYQIDSFDKTTLIGQTVDDAAGEAFDKSAKMIGLGYPGGPVINKRANEGDDQSFAFTTARVKMGDQYLSFSGLKTAAWHHVKEHEPLNPSQINDLCASLQKGIVDALIKKVRYFADKTLYKSFGLSGGVAMNTLLRGRCQAVCDELGIQCLIAEPQYCTDNGAMIAHVACVRSLEDELFTLSTEPSKKIKARSLKK